jgi:nucleoside-diphosphate-sugar epimerase
MMRILVAGGAGYIGSALIPKLLERGYHVDVVDLFWFGNALPVEVGIVHQDLFDLQASDLKKYKQVIFLAGLSNDPMAEQELCLQCGSPGLPVLHRQACRCPALYLR